MFVQEATELTKCMNFIPTKMRIRLPEGKTDTCVYILSDSFEYDIETIKGITQPKLDYKNIIIPFKVDIKLGGQRFSYALSANEYNREIKYVSEQKMLPPLNVIRYPYPKTIKENVYVSMADVIKGSNQTFKKSSMEYVKGNIFSMFLELFKPFAFSKNRILYIDTSRYKIYNTTDSDEMYSTDIINAIIRGYFDEYNTHFMKLPITIIFHGPDNDFKFDMGLFERRDLDRFQAMLDTIGRPLPMAKPMSDTTLDTVDDTEETIETNDEDLDDNPLTSTTAVNTINSTVNAIKSKLAANGQVVDEDEEDIIERENDAKLRRAKEMNVQAELLRRISVNTGTVGSYKHIALDMTSNSDNPVEDKYLTDASKKVADVAIAKNNTNANDTRTAAREQKMRERIGKLKLGKITFDTLVSVTDIPKPAPIVPLHISTINAGSLKGTSFAHISKAYEENLMDRDIVATFMNLANLPDGFEVTNVEVTDISDVQSLIYDWKVSLRSKATSRQNVIHVRVPKVIDEKFYVNGVWFHLGKQDFPIPILKLGPKRVMLTSNYQKITVERYDTRSLVDITSLVKVLSKLVDEQGMNKYTRPGSSVTTNARFLSTVEYDEYAKIWFSFINKEAKVEIYFDRNQCLKLYGFVNCEETEFCCGMINQVPIIIDTDTGVTRDERTITDIIVQSLPPAIQEQYQKIKPGKRSMYSEMNATVKTPVGLTCCAWEGLTTVLKKANIDYKIVGKRDLPPIGYYGIEFADCKLIMKNSIPNQLLMNGFNMIDTKGYRMSDFETPIMDSNSIYIDIYNNHFFKQYSQLTTFIAYYNFFVDAITSDVCLHYNLPNDLVGMLIYASNMLADNNFVVENTASLYRIRSSEVVPAIIHSEIAFAISRYNNSAGSKSRDHMLKFNANSVILMLQKLGTTETANALNPMVELHQRETITQRGFHGVNKARAYSRAKRSYHESMIGKEAMSTPNSANVGINRQLVVDPKIESVRGYTSTEGVDTDYNDLQLASYSELLTPGSVSHDDAIRTAIATSQTSHIVQTADSQPVLISNGVDEIASTAVTDSFCVVAEEDGKVIDGNDDYLIIQYKSGKKRAIEINNRYQANPASGFYVNNKLQSTFQKNDSFKKNDIIAYHEKFFTKGIDGVVRMNIGPLAKVAITSAYFTFEDSGMMTESFSKKLKTTLTMVETIKLNATDNVEQLVKVGDEVEYGDPICVLGLGDTGDKSVDNFIKSFQVGSNSSILDSAKRKFTCKHAGRVVDVKMYTVKSMDKLSPSLNELLSKHFAENAKRKKILDRHDNTDSVYKLDTMYDRPTGPLKGQTIKGITTDVMIEVYIEHEDLQSIGDKLVAFAASKQVIGDMIPVGQEPYSESRPDEEISVFVSCRSILNRMIPGLLVTAAGNKVLVEAKRAIRRIWES